jgi:hypothetical protein
LLAVALWGVLVCGLGVVAEVAGLEGAWASVAVAWAWVAVVAVEAALALELCLAGVALAALGAEEDVAEALALLGLVGVCPEACAAFASTSLPWRWEMAAASWALFTSRPSPPRAGAGLWVLLWAALAPAFAVEECVAGVPWTVLGVVVLEPGETVLVTTGAEEELAVVGLLEWPWSANSHTPASSTTTTSAS